MWMLPVHGFARRRKAHIGRNETPLILVHAGGAVKTFRLHPAFFVRGQKHGRANGDVAEHFAGIAAFLDSLTSTRYDIVR